LYFVFCSDNYRDLKLSMKSPSDILHHYWGYSHFRPLQEDIIQSVLEKNDTLAILPTGGGKSICFQVPGLILEGITIVISPLIALIKDQVQNLQKRNIKAIAIYSGLSKREIDLLLDNCVYGEIKFLYVSPERLETDLFKARLAKMNVSLLAIDEAHCISQWGYDFRPSYLKIAEARDIIKDAPVMALTATATRQVQDDICEKLLFKNEKRFQGSFERKNISYVVRQVEDKFSKMKEILSKTKGTAIVYAGTRKRTVEIADFLKKNKFSADYYHAGLKSEQRSLRQDAWIAGKTRIIVSTNAFGMGIDKPDVRCVVHADLPESMEAYYQEAGRAGRDGLRSYAVLLYNLSDKLNFEQKLNKNFPSFDEVLNIYDALGNYLKLAVGSGEGESFEFDIGTFAVNFKFPVQKILTALHLLEQQELLSVSDAVYLPSRIKFIVDRETLYRFQVLNARYDPLIKLILRTAQGVMDEYSTIKESDLSRAMNLPVTEVQQQLRFLQQNSIADYIYATDLPLITFIKPRNFSKYLHLDKNFITQRRKIFETQLRSMLDYSANKQTCRSKNILNYFGEEGHRCGVCDICLELNKMGLSELKFEELHENIKELLTNQPATFNEVYEHITQFSKENILHILKWLMDNGQVAKDEQDKLIWIH
jgi:ATP-dependent DNA helicase RecQ